MLTLPLPRRREKPVQKAAAPKVGKHSTVGVISRLEAELAKFRGLQKAICRTGQHMEFWTNTPAPVACPGCAVAHHAGRVRQLEAQLADAQALDAWATDANANPVSVAAPADSGAREVAAAQDTEATDVAALRAGDTAELLMVVPGPDGEQPGKAVDGPEAEEPEADEGAPTVATPVALDDDTLTLPRPALPPQPEVHVTDTETTQPIVTLDPQLRMATPVKPIPGSTDPAAIPANVRVGTLAELATTT